MRKVDKVIISDNCCIDDLLGMFLFRAMFHLEGINMTL